MSTRLNLGCGDAPIAGAVNHDRTRHRPEVDIVWDLNRLPWPWPNNSFDVIVAKSVLEHLNLDLIESVNECWRLLRPEGLLYMKLPMWNSEASYLDPTHRWRVALRTCDVFDPDTPYGAQYSFYTPHKWKIVKGPELSPGGSSVHITLQVRKS